MQEEGSIDLDDGIVLTSPSLPIFHLWAPHADRCSSMPRGTDCFPLLAKLTVGDKFRVGQLAPLDVAVVEIASRRRRELRVRNTQRTRRDPHSADRHRYSSPRGCRSIREPLPPSRLRPDSPVFAASATSFVGVWAAIRHVAELHQMGFAGDPVAAPIDDARFLKQLQEIVVVTVDIANRDYALDSLATDPLRRD